MIVSASRRTDIPAFYARWFMERIRGGVCWVPNPWFPDQISRVSLKPEDVDAIVFWTRNPKPLFPYLQELDQRGYRYMFLYTLMANPRSLDPFAPRSEKALNTLKRLAERVGPERIWWRYDPIVRSSVTDFRFHERTYAHLAACLDGYTCRSIVSFMDRYRKLNRRFQQLASQGVTIRDITRDWAEPVLRSLVDIARYHKMAIHMCADQTDYRHLGIVSGKCIDGAYMSDLFGVKMPLKKDPSQRRACGCTQSKDIGMYDTCLFGCQYCYATSDVKRARMRYKRHNPSWPMLIEYSLTSDQEIRIREDFPESGRKDQ